MAEKSRATILGENLKRIRKEKNISRQELASKTGIASNMIGEYETGRKLPPLDKIFILADSLDVATTDITGENKKAVDKKVFEYRFERAKKMLEFLDGFTGIVGYDPLKINDTGNITINTNEKITYDANTGGFSYGGAGHSITFRNAEIFVDIMEQAEQRALYRQIPFNQALIELVAEAKQE